MKTMLHDHANLSKLETNRLYLNVWYKLTYTEIEDVSYMD